MTIIGKRIRMERIVNRNTGKTVIVPMDHGISVGPIAGLENMKDAVEHIYNILDDFDETNESCDYFSEIKRHMFFITKFIKRMEGIE